MAGGDGWWTLPLPPSSPTRSLQPRAASGGGFGVNVGGEGDPFGAFAFPPTSAGSFPSLCARSYYPGPAGVMGDETKAEVKSGIVVADMCFGDWRTPPLPPLQQQQEVLSPARNGKSIAERRAARCGFSAPKINTAKFRCSGSPICSPAAVRSPCLTIPPGLSPTALLDSPVFLMDAQAQPSPRTGTFLLSPRNHDDLDSSFIFKLTQGHISVARIQNIASKDHAGFGELVPTIYAGDSQSVIEASHGKVAEAKNIAIPSHDPHIIKETQLEEQQNRNDISQHLRDGDLAGALQPSCMGRPSEDGFNWRKYGQKQVKGSEYPRSYYKCTHPDCQVKKKVERSYDGQITEIIYKGKHNHPKPQPARRSIIGPSFPVIETSETTENPGSSMTTEGKSVWSNHHGSEDDRSVDCPTDGLERISSTSAVTDLSDPLSSVIEKHLSELESTSNLELSSTVARHVDDDDQATQESMPLEGDDEDDKSNLKIRKDESYLIEASSSSRAVREPRVVVQTESEVDILDDGYRWRKYGQKVVKGNPNPRSYYKCTNPGCSVRKHVERAAHDLKSVITTYEGKHNHEVPMARNSSHNGPSGGSFPPASNGHTAMVLPGSTRNQELTTNGKNLAPHLKRKLGLSLYGDAEFGASSCYEVKLLQQLALQPSGPITNHTALLPTSSIANLIPEFPTSFQMNAALTGPSIGHGRATGVAVQSLLGQQPNESEVRLLKAPKQEQEDDAFCSDVLAANNLTNALPSLCSQILGGYPLQ
uniref:Putative WRKY transcription factor 2 n=1 Tax=Anthurium amnicola TaxID=1678845 RepID=A0A1D1Y2X1_9ARAE